MRSKAKLMCLFAFTLAAAPLPACSSVVIVTDDSGASSSATTAAASGSSASGSGGGPAASVSSSSSSAGGGGTSEPPPADEAVAYQINAAHTGAVENDTLTPPLTTRWTVDLGARVSYPLIAGGRVFVTIGSSKVAAKLVALDQTTGKTLWGPVELGGIYAVSHAAYAEGKVFTLNSAGQLRAFEAATGNELWSLQLFSNQVYVPAPPTAYGGKVFVSFTGATATYFAVDQATGMLDWKQYSNAPLGWNPPVVSEKAAYFACACGGICGFDRTTGESIWPQVLDCESFSANDPVLFEDHFYLRGASFNLDGILDAKTREVVGSFTQSTLAAFHEGRAFFVSQYDMVARSTPDMKQLWSLPGVGPIWSPPLVVNGRVYVGTTATAVVAADEQTGVPVWSATLGPETTYGIDDEWGSAAALGAGGGALIVPWGHFLSALW